MERDGLTLEEYLDEQRKEILSPLNRHGAGQVLGREPNEDELAHYYVQCGASDRFRQAHPRRDA